MPKAKSQIEEIQDLAAALCEWFKSQEIGTGRATATMGFLIGVMAAERSKDEVEALDRILLVDAAMIETAMDAMKTKRRG